MHFSENQKDETNGKLDLLGTMIVDMRQHFDTEWAILREQWETASESNKEMIKALMANVVTSTRSNPENVTDVVIHIGTNDKQKAMTAQEANDGIGRFQSKYKRCFKKHAFTSLHCPPLVTNKRLTSI